jgi:hypothetical protein
LTARLFIPTLAFISTVFLGLTACDTTRLKPCCRLKPGYGGFDRFRTLTLSQKTSKQIAVYQTEKYLILVDRKKAESKLSIELGHNTSQSFIRSDTLFIDNRDGSWGISKFITTEIDRHNAVIIDRVTGQKLVKVKRRKFNWQTDPKAGRGGKEYIDIDKNYVIIRLDYWIS